MTNRLLSGYRIVETHFGDTLQRIAARELGDATRWPDIANINGLQPPYLTADPTQASATVKLYGQTLMVPAATDQAPGAIDVDTLYGTDVALVGGELSDDGNGDFLTVTGVDNLRQGLQNRLDTPLADLLFYPAYGNGVWRLRGSANGPTVGLLSAQYAASALAQDDRVASVLSADAQVTGDATLVTASVQPITGAPVDISSSAS